MIQSLFKIILVVLIPLSFIFSQEEKKVLVEVFTNSHCPLCPPAHSTINNYLAGPNGNKINFIFYHMEYPYSDDLLYQHNSIDSDGRDDYYNPVRATPRGFFDGQIQGSTSGWASILDNLVAIESPLKIDLSGTKTEGTINVKVEVTNNGEIPENDLVIHFVVVENLNYTGRNNISHHKNIMRDMVDGASGSPLSINMNETIEIERGVTINNAWIKDSLKVIVFIQSHSYKTVYQSAVINYSELNDPTGTDTDKNLPEEFRLEQNYPNPFNPSTNIIYSIPEDNFVSLKVYNILGMETASLFNQQQTAGNYEIIFDAGTLSSGIYIYKLTAVNSSGRKIIRTKTMTLVR